MVLTSRCALVVALMLVASSGLVASLASGLNFSGKTVYIKTEDYSNIHDADSYFSRYHDYAVKDEDVFEVEQDGRVVFNPELQDILQTMCREIIVSVDDDQDRANFLSNNSIAADLRRRGYIVGATGDIMPAHIKDMDAIRAYYGLKPLNETQADTRKRGTYFATINNFQLFDDPRKDWCLTSSSDYYAGITCKDSLGNSYDDAVWTGQVYTTPTNPLDHPYMPDGCRFSADMYVYLYRTYDAGRSDFCDSASLTCSIPYSNGGSYYQTGGFGYIMKLPDCAVGPNSVCTNTCNCSGGYDVIRSYRTSSDNNKKDHCTGATINCMGQANYNQFERIGYQCTDYTTNW